VYSQHPVFQHLPVQGCSADTQELGGGFPVSVSLFQSSQDAFSLQAGVFERKGE